MFTPMSTRGSDIVDSVWNSAGHTSSSRCTADWDISTLVPRLRRVATLSLERNFVALFSRLMSLRTIEAHPQRETMAVSRMDGMTS